MKETNSTARRAEIRKIAFANAPITELSTAFETAIKSGDHRIRKATVSRNGRELQFTVYPILPAWVKAVEAEAEKEAQEFEALHPRPVKKVRTMFVQP